MKDNKLIAEFMGWKRGTNEETNTNQFFLAQPDHWYLKNENELEFHTSWDWLMPVIIKIASLTDHGIKIGHLETIQSAYEFAVKFIEADNSPYPFSEGDEHWVEEDGEYIWSVWDDISEELHDQNPNKQYYTSAEFINIARQGGFTIR